MKSAPIQHRHAEDSAWSRRERQRDQPRPGADEGRIPPLVWYTQAGAWDIAAWRREHIPFGQVIASEGVAASSGAPRPLTAGTALAGPTTPLGPCETSVDEPTA